MIISLFLVRSKEIGIDWFVFVAASRFECDLGLAAPGELGSIRRARPHGYDSAAGCFIAQSAYRALDGLMTAAGAHQLAYAEPFQRCFRDALAATQQPSNNWDNGRIARGRALLEGIKG
jgi:hypothetical protein